MLQRGDVESRTVSALLLAMDDREITLAEFADVVEPLTPEALQVIATALRSCVPIDSHSQQQFWRAHSICSRRAAATRILS